MDKYLVEILKETNTIIIPGIGALTMTDRSTGEVMFMSFLKHDDGALAKFIGEKEGLGIDEAKDKVTSYVHEIEAKLSAGESYDMPAFGSFRKDNSGDLIFEQYKGKVDASAPIDLPSEPVVEDQPVQELKTVAEEVVVAESASIEQVEPVANETEEPTVIEETALQETVVEPESAAEETIIEEVPVQETVVEPEIIQATDAIVEESKQEEVLYTEEQQWNDDLDLPPVNATIERPKQPILEKAKPDKKRRSPMLLILIIAAVIALGGATTIVLYGENLGLFMAKEEVKEQAEVEQDEDKIDEWYDAEETEDSEEGEEQDEEDDVAVVTENKPAVKEQKPAAFEVKKVTPAPTYRNGIYHIVAGAFGDVSNAERLVAKLSAAGFQAQVLGQLNGLHIVSAGSYSSQQEAESALKENAANLPKAWILNKQ